LDFWSKLPLGFLVMKSRTLALPFASVLACASVMACGGMQSQAAKAQEAAQNLNMDARLGRLDTALEHVDRKTREVYTKVHTQWGTKIRIVDAEITSFKMAKDEDSADVDVQVSWYKPETGELHITVLHQKWHAANGDWVLSSEERADGDTGLLGERVVVEQPDAPAPRAQFQSVRIAD
jgi:hypothetical protein